MMTKALGVLLLFVGVQNICTATIPEEFMGTNVLATPNLHFSHPETGVALEGEYTIENLDSHHIQVFSFRGVGCNCERFTCQCCAGIDVSWLPRTSGCISVGYVPSASAVKLALTLNNNEVISKMISLKNPMALCVSIPYVPGGKICVRLHNIEVVGDKLQACVNMEVQFFGSTVYRMEFDCIRLGHPVLDEQMLPAKSKIKPEPYSLFNRTSVKQDQ